MSLLAPIAAGLALLAPGAGSWDGARVAAEFEARPTNGRGPFGYTVPEHSPPHCTAHFCVHWVATTPDAPSPRDADGRDDGDGVPDHVERIAAYAERSRRVENGDLGWRLPKRDGVRGGDTRADVYVTDFNRGPLGVTIPEPGINFAVRSAAYIAIDDDYSAREYPGSNADNLLRATVAHEYNHVLQFAYLLALDYWMAESTATWMQDRVFPAGNDYLRQVNRWRRKSMVPLTFPDPRKAYGSAVWEHWLDGRYGPELIRRAWERLLRVRPRTLGVAAFGSAIRAAGRRDFAREFAAFAAATAEWRSAPAFAPDGAFYGDVVRRGRLAPGDSIVRQIDHTAYVLLDIPVRPGRALVLRARSQPGADTAFALVGRRGRRRGGEVDTVLRFASGGGARTLRLANPNRYDRITAVLVNADPTPTRRVSDLQGLIYRYDDVRFEAELRIPR